MRTLSLPTAALAVGFAVCIAAPLASAQTAFVLDDPVLVADGRRVPVEGAPLRQDRFERLVLDVPSVGRYTIADAPFAGARRAGDFDGNALVFAADGVSVRLRSRGPILSTSRRPAYVLAAPSARRLGSAQVGLGDAMGPVASRETSRREARTTPRGPARREIRESPEPLRDEVARLRAEVGRLAAEREAAARQRDGSRRTLQADLDRVQAERDALRAERDRALAERRDLAAEMERTRREAETARERDARTMNARERAEAQRLGADLDRLRREVVARDEAIATLTAERDDRSEQIARLDAEVQRLATALDAAHQERDAALQQADLAMREAAEAVARLDLPRSDNSETAGLRAEVERLAADLARTRDERDRLAALTTVQTPDLDAREGEMDRLMAELEQARTELAAMAAQLEASEAARLALEAEVAAHQNAGPATAAAQAERETLVRERDRLRAEVQTLTAEVARLRNGGSTPPRSAPPAQSGNTLLLLPGFDFGRLQNPDEVRRRLDATLLPAGARGEVLVLFQTDDTGKVIRTAVARPVGGGLDGIAEQLVRAMHFFPAEVDGQPTGLRSQVVIRFGAGT